MSHHPSVVQGYFPNGLLRVSPPPAAHTVVQRRLAQPSGPQGFSRPAQPAGPAVQRLANGTATQLPQTLALFGFGPGQPLPEPVQRKMEATFNSSFADVRIHVGPQAAAIGALAFTHGSNIYFAPGQYNPIMPHGQRLLGHELTHVVQQRAGRARNPFGSGVAVVQDQALEAEADRMGFKAASPTALVFGVEGLVQTKALFFPSASVVQLRHRAEAWAGNRSKTGFSGYGGILSARLRNSRLRSATRLYNILDGVKNKLGGNPWHAFDCAEPNAVGSLVLSGSSLGSIVITAIQDVESGAARRPCKNCQQWLKHDDEYNVWYIADP